MVADFFPALDQSLVKRVELIVARLDFLLLVPLRHRAFDQRGRRVGVVFQQLGRVDTVVSKIKTAKQQGVVGVLRIHRVFNKPVGQRERLERAFGDDMFDRVDAQLVQLSCRLFDHLDFAVGKAITCRLIPVHIVKTVKMKAEIRELALSVGARLERFALH